MSISPPPATEGDSAAALSRLRAALAEIASIESWQLADAELLRTTEQLYRLTAAASAQSMRMLTEIDQRGLAADAGSPTTPAWLTANVQMNTSAARKELKLAHALTRLPATAQALAAGAVTVDHAAVITATLDALPATVDPAVSTRAELTLLDEATRFTPRLLTRIGQRLVSAVDPDGPEPDDEDRPEPAYFLNARTRDDGSCEGEFWVDPGTAIQLIALIDAASAPRPTTAEGPDLRTAGQRRADAFAELVDVAAASPDPVTGTSRIDVLVTIPLADLRDGLPGRGPDRSLISASTMRRLACDAGIIPAVLSSKGEVLDIGRQRRGIPVAIRRALILRDKGCAFPGCHAPPGWSQAHHIRHWAHGGPTRLHNLVLLCRHHHKTVHHRGWQVHLDHDRLPAFTAPAWLRSSYALTV